MTATILIVLAGLMGAAGIVLAAAGAHGHPGAGLDSAGYLLVMHAVAIAGGLALAQQGLLSRPLGTVALFGFVVGAALFAADVALRVFIGHRLFPMAAPAGGTLLIVSWLAFAVAGMLASR